jgi:rare lipoprotein A
MGRRCAEMATRLLIPVAALFFAGTALAGEGGGRTIEVGIASWYGGKHLVRTASGEPLDADGMTAAHRSLPFDSKVRVTNLENGKSVIVRITDRGPFKRGRVIDVSRRAAHALGILRSGLARVTLELVPEAAS